MMTRRDLFRLVAMTMFAVPVLLQLGCDRGDANGEVNAAAMHEGQGEEVTADPQFQVTLKIEGAGEQAFAGPRLNIYEARPAKPDAQQRPQGFELRAGSDFVLAGHLPEQLNLAPKRTFEMLVDQPMTVRRSGGGDPALPMMSKIRLSDGTVYVAEEGTLTVEKAFHRKGKYAGVSGQFEVTLQQIQLGDPDDPQNKGDQPIGEPVKASGSFTAHAMAYPYEQL